MKVFVIGAYRLGGVLIPREIVTTVMHAGEGFTFATGAAGEDKFLIFPDKSPNVAGVLELDLGMVAGCSSDYAIGDTVDGIFFHYNPGAILRNIQCANPAADVNAWTGMTSVSGTAGSFIVLTEDTLTNSTPYGYGGGTWGTDGMHASRIYLRQMYFLTNPAAAYTDVMCISQ